jgi:conjugal transfer mating pair stabilization protein TraG
MTQEQIAEFKQFGDRVSRDSSVVDSFASDSREGQEMSSRLSSATSRAKRADATFSERTAFAERLSSARDRGESISVDIAQDPHNLEMFLRYAEQYGGTSAAAHSMFDAELARQGLRPNRSFSDGTALPNSFGDVHRLHDHQAADPGLSPDLAAANQQQRAKVSRSNQPTQSAISGTNPSPLRGDIQTRGDALRNEADAAGSRFDQKAEIVDTGDGTLATKKSLLKQSGKQVVNDAEASINDARDAVNDLLRKKK